MVLAPRMKNQAQRSMPSVLQQCGACERMLQMPLISKRDSIRFSLNFFRDFNYKLKAINQSKKHAIKCYVT